MAVGDAYDPANDPTQGVPSYQPTGGGNWWEGPPPPGYTSAMGPWPPTLPPGAHYGTNLGEIVYGQPAPTFTAASPIPNNPGFTPPPPKTAADLLPPAASTPGGTYVPPGGPAAPLPKLVDPPVFNTPPPTIPSGVPGGPPPAYRTPAPFVFDPYTQAAQFKAPTAGDLLADPSMQFRLDQGRKALENSAAGRGVLNTGGSLKDMLGYGQDFASQEYKNVWDRSLSAYNTNEDQRFKTYSTNELGKYQTWQGNNQTQFDQPNANALDIWKTQATQGQQTGQTNYQNAYNVWKDQYDQWRQNKNDLFDQRFRTAAG